MYSPDYALEAEKVYGARDEPAHPTIQYLRTTQETVCIGGKIVKAVRRPARSSHQELRCTFFFVFFLSAFQELTAKSD